MPFQLSGGASAELVKLAGGVVPGPAGFGDAGRLNSGVPLGLGRGDLLVGLAADLLDLSGVCGGGLLETRMGVP